MTEIPAHLLARARQARQKSQPEPQTVEVPVDKLELLKDWLDRDRDTPFDRNGNNIVYVLHDLVACIPEPAYEPDAFFVSDYAHAQDCSTEAARAELIDLHRAGFTVLRNDDLPER